MSIAKIPYHKRTIIHIMLDVIKQTHRSNKKDPYRNLYDSWKKDKDTYEFFQQTRDHVYLHGKAEMFHHPLLIELIKYVLPKESADLFQAEIHNTVAFNAAWVATEIYYFKKYGRYH